MNSKHTPGPWVVDGSVGMMKLDVYAFAGQVRIAMIDCEYADMDEAEVEANAMLIAAAPDLLAALQAIISHDRHLLPNPWRIEAAISAIAKATGNKA